MKVDMTFLGQQFADFDTYIQALSQLSVLSDLLESEKSQTIQMIDHSLTHSMNIFL